MVACQVGDLPDHVVPLAVLELEVVGVAAQRRAAVVNARHQRDGVKSRQIGVDPERQPVVAGPVFVVEGPHGVGRAEDAAIGAGLLAPGVRAKPQAVTAVDGALVRQGDVALALAPIGDLPTVQILHVVQQPGSLHLFAQPALDGRVLLLDRHRPLGRPLRGDRGAAKNDQPEQIGRYCEKRFTHRQLPATSSFSQMLRNSMFPP